MPAFLQRFRYFPRWRDPCFPTLCVVLLVLPGSVHSAEDVSLPGKLSECASIADPVLRLGCYDKAAGRTIAGPGGPYAPSVPLETPGVSAAAKSRFGENGQLRGDVEFRRSMPKQIKVNVKRVAALPNGRYLLTLDNDEIWQTTERDWAVEFRPDEPITISRLPLGGYQIASTGQHRSVGIKRIN